MTKKIQCLLVEDDLDDQEIFQMCLKKISPDIECSVSNNGVDALAMLEKIGSYTPDYIFMDVNMPKMNGIECLTRIKKISRLNDSKIFMYSTTSEKSVLTQTKDLGAHEFIVKPAKTKDLKDKLASIFQIVNQTIKKLEDPS
jgi:CheY-like chemotaxis protein